MILITRANENDAQLLSKLAEQTFIESHGKSAKWEEINNFIEQNYNEPVLEKELQDPRNIFHLLYHSDTVAGYSKMVLDSPYLKSEVKNVAKLERIYLLKEFYHLNLGSTLFEFNADLAKQNNQSGMWLFVWIENRRAIDFYRKKGFSIIGIHDFKISENHSNPNHQMFLGFK
ncbi:MAG: GNAT family N-acetyltransferase [Ginsengibacter sp.]